MYKQIVIACALLIVIPKITFANENFNGLYTGADIGPTQTETGLKQTVDSDEFKSTASKESYSSDEKIKS